VLKMLEADVFKLTVLEPHRAISSSNLPLMMVLLHERLWFACPDKIATVARAGAAIQKIMENSERSSVPLEVELS
jgi:DNA polymerase I-like protein with 3'-5' exonuclease and polymerase domains